MKRKWRYCFTLKNYVYGIDRDNSVYTRKNDNNSPWKLSEIGDDVSRLREGAYIYLYHEGPDGFKFKVGTLEDFLSKK